MNHKFLLSLSTLGLLTGLTPLDAPAQTFYQCMPCPAGTYYYNGYCKSCPKNSYSSSAGSTSCTACSSGYHAPGTGNTSCILCASNTKWYNGECYSYNDSNNYNVAANPSQGYCTSGTLYAGNYIVYLRGGNGGNGYYNKSTYSGKSGGTVKYQFTLNSSVSYQLCAGDNGESHSSMGGGGGAGSWIKIGNKYIVAGGGGGGGRSENAWGQAGGGGAVGAGGGSDCDSDGHGALGGKVGDYNYGSRCDGGSKTGAWGQGINNDNRGRGGHNGASTAAEAKGIILYSDYITTKVGGTANASGSATHNSNISISLTCDKNGGCAKLYKFKY